MGSPKQPIRLCKGHATSRRRSRGRRNRSTNETIKKKMKATSMVMYRVVGHDKTTNRDVLGVFANRDIYAGEWVHGSEYVGEIRETHDIGDLDAFHARLMWIMPVIAAQTREGHTNTTESHEEQKKKKKQVVCNGADTLHTGHLGAYINTHISTGRTANVGAPYWVGDAHTALRDIPCGEELLVSYGSSHKLIIDGSLSGVQWFDEKSALFRADSTQVLVPKPPAVRNHNRA
jgi:hypothetical protein